MIAPAVSDEKRFGLIILPAPERQLKTQGPVLEVPALYVRPILRSGNTLLIRSYYHRKDVEHTCDPCSLPSLKLVPMGLCTALHSAKLL